MPSELRTIWLRKSSQDANLYLKYTEQIRENQGESGDIAVGRGAQVGLRKKPAVDSTTRRRRRSWSTRLWAWRSSRFARQTAHSTTSRWDFTYPCHPSSSVPRTNPPIVLRFGQLGRSSSQISVSS